MKLSEKWLQEWVIPEISREALIHKLTMAGISVESSELVEDDCVFEFELTPNRADCLSTYGIAREISIITETPFSNNTHTFLENKKNFTNKSDLTLKIDIQTPADCPRYLGRIIKNISTPTLTAEFLNLQKKLSKSGIKLIHPIVDIMNYVMLELGQPLHAFDFDKLTGDTIIIRRAKNQEKITLLDQKELTLSDDTLVIADNNQSHAIAGIMGGWESCVTENTQAIFIESAFFSPDIIAGRARRYGLHTDASHRFERGVDPMLPKLALQRATELLQYIYPNLIISEIFDRSIDNALPQSSKINLRFDRVNKILGTVLSENDILTILKKLNCTILQNGSITNKNQANCDIIPPTYRFDIAQEIDLIEEIARIYGYENIQATRSALMLYPEKIIANAASSITANFKKNLVYQGYQEVITYSFISENEQRLCDPDNTPLYLKNPLSSEFSVMRTNLWPGLLQVVKYNFNRQQDYLRFFEEGLKFHHDKQQPVLSGIWAGKAFHEQWDSHSKRNVDFFDVKNSIEQLFSLTTYPELLTFEADYHPALHPAQTAKILMKGNFVGHCGALHPKLQQEYELKIPIFLFEIDLTVFDKETTFISTPQFQAFSKFPSIRRDIALIVDRNMTITELKNLIYAQNESTLTDICVFDVYQDKKLLQTNQKSIAIGLTFQCLAETLSEEKVQSIMNNIIQRLTSKPHINLRES